MKKPIIFVCFFAIATFAYSDTSNIDISSISNSTDIVRILSSLPYAHVDQDFHALSKFNFWQRQSVVLKIIQTNFVLAETNALMQVADYISQGHPLPTERKDIDFRNALKHDRFMQYGDSNYVVRAGGKRYGPTSLAVRDLYMFRGLYNEKLAHFRISAFRDIKYELARPRWNIYTEDERKALLEEFFRRANATEEELEKVR